jgi:hypothetical protein
LVGTLAAAEAALRRDADQREAETCQNYGEDGALQAESPLQDRRLGVKVAGLDGGNAMKRLLAAMLTIILGCPALAKDDARTNTMINIAQVMAAQRLCTQLQPNDILVRTIAGMQDIDFDPDSPDGKVLLAMTQNAVAKMSELGEAAVCAAGRELYGPQGTAVPNLLIDK